MPVVGHAFAGLATAVQFGPASVRDPRQPTAGASAWWAPAVVAAAYLPDIVTQVGGAVGVSHANAYGHSPALGVIAGLALGSAWSAAAGTSLIRAVVIATGSILGHDLLDAVQAMDWPWPGRIVRSAPFGLSPRIVSEAILSALLFAMFLLWRFATGRSSRTSASRLSRSPALGWMPRTIVAVILITAVGTYVLRGRHERQLNAARRLLDNGNYAGALDMADKADAWPHGNRPGRIDMIRAEAHQRLGHHEAAEALYLSVYEKDPNNFWALADLAECYASSVRPTAERRRLARLRASELQRRFPKHPSLHNVLDGIERELSRADPTE